jgi:D-alanyl-D-alanine carboxypeptidase
VPSHRAVTSPPVARREQRERRSGRRTTHRAKGSSLTVQQMGIAGALGLATVIAPVSGLMASPAPAKATSNEILTPRVAAPAFPLRAAAANGVEHLRLVPEAPDPGSSVSKLAAPRDLLVTQPSRGHGRAVLPGCSGQVPLLKPGNGQLPPSMLCDLWDGKHQLRADAAISLAKLNVAYVQEFGTPICLTDAYRSLNQQYAVKAERGYFAATPGTSVHGLGRAVDLCDGVENFGSRQHQWMVDNAPRYGWVNPDWAQPGGGGPREAWHWEWNCDVEAGCEAS